MTDIFERAKSEFVFIDGGCGSILQAQGLKPGELPETWNLIHPEIIVEMHKNYLLSGVNILTSNTFGANINKFKPGDFKFSLEKIIEGKMKKRKKLVLLL